jgi:hypothetical protein
MNLLVISVEKRDTTYPKGEEKAIKSIEVYFESPKKYLTLT